MSKWHWCFRLLPAGGDRRGRSGVACLRPTRARRRLQPVVQVSCQPTPTWVVNFEAIPERSAPDEDSDPIATLRQFTYLAVTRLSGRVGRGVQSAHQRQRLRAQRRHRADRSAARLHHRRSATQQSTRSISTGGPSAARRCRSIRRLIPRRRPKRWPTTRRSRSPTASKATTAATWYRTADGDYLPEYDSPLAAATAAHVRRSLDRRRSARAGHAGGLRGRSAGAHHADHPRRRAAADARSACSPFSAASPTRR